MKRRSTILLTVSLAVASAAGSACILACGGGAAVGNIAAEADSVATHAADSCSVAAKADSLPLAGDWKKQMQAMAERDSVSRYSSLTEEDYRVVAGELGVEVAAIKAVVRIEAGASLQGFLAPGVPVINFDRSMYRKARSSSKVKAPASEKVPDGITNAYGRREWAQLVAARKVNLEKANMGTFWGMFQIGGFNYKLCGCSSVQEFVDRMSFSEFEQLQLFANFIKNAGMLTDLRNKNWAGFARKYNGSSYRSRGYHTRMAREYKKYKAQENK